jgi:hypothetical protein
MARGTVVGEPVVSQANNEEFREGYARTFGDKPVVRGHWVWDPINKCLVDSADCVPLPEAKDAPILSGRFYENTAATDGTDIGSRRRHREYMKSRGLTTADDFKDTWKREEARRQREAKGEWDHKARREDIGRALYESSKRHGR